MTPFTEDSPGGTTPAARGLNPLAGGLRAPAGQGTGAALESSPQAPAAAPGPAPSPARGSASSSPLYPRSGEEEAPSFPGLAGGPGAPGDGSRPRSPGAQVPPGGTRLAAASPGGTTGREWTVELPAGIRVATLNDRDHHMARYQKMQVLKNAAIVVTRQARLPKLDRITFGVVYDPPDDMDERDADNLAPTLKALLDGVAHEILPTRVNLGPKQRRVVGLDDRRHVKRVWIEIGDAPVRKGRLRMIIADLGGAA